MAPVNIAAQSIKDMTAARAALSFNVETVRDYLFAFEPVFLGQASSAMMSEYWDLVSNKGIQGCYLQTELGHGSNVACLETTATYIPEAHEFEIHSPTLTSTKCLILPGGENVGPHLFLVQLRSLEDHTTLPGISIGDIGPKAGGGLAALDNGLCKMMYIRASMVTFGGWTIARGECDEHGLERQVIQYPSTYYRLLPILSRAYVFIALGRQTMKEFTTVTERSERGDFTKLSEIHAILCGLKALVTNTVVRDLETARRALGGHGYSAFAGIGRLYADYLPTVTYEGDNFVLNGQVVRAAVKSYQAFISTPASPLDAYSSYIRLLKGNNPKPVMETAIWQNSDSIVHLLEWRAALVLNEFVQTLDNLDANANQRLSKAVTDAFVAVRIGEMITGLDVLPRRESNIIRALYHLYLLTTTEDALVDLFSTGLLQQSRDRELRLAIKHHCLQLLPDAIGLTDAFSFSDWALDSALGVSDGRVYEEIWRRAQLEPLNQLGNTPGYYESLRPMLQEGQKLAKKVSSRL
ncbi:acyl-CoA dehydrogenase/oxidase C-terminal [Pisolithus croceorrhizus]|nr:acyl-CoA dehydrogenase/oxidase C-terminal [Pisolithus croceorrhizus]